MPFGTLEQPCQCGCGEYANPGREFRRGHDRRLYGVLLRATRSGDENAHNELVRRGWTAEAGYGSYRVTNSARHQVAREVQRRAGLAHIGVSGMTAILSGNTGILIGRENTDPAYIPNREARRASLRRNATVDGSLAHSLRYDSESRGFGVELETFGASRDAIIRELRSGGITNIMNVDNYDSRVHHDVPQWKLVPDSSIHGDGAYGDGVEVVSPVLRGSAGLAELKIAIEALRRAGARVNQSTGLHVHHSADDLSSVILARICRVYMTAQTAIDSILANHRRSENRCNWCQPYDSYRVESLESRALQMTDMARFTSGLDRYFVTNLYAYQAHRTVEFRQHQGTLNFTKVRAWVLLTRGILELAASGITELPTTLDQVCSATNLPDDISAYLARRSTELVTRREYASGSRW